MTLRLFDYAPSLNCYKVRLALAQLGFAYERVPVAIFAGASRTPDFLARNPMGAVPVLEFGPGDALPESNAILARLTLGTPLAPADPAGIGRMLRWMFFEQEYVQASIAILRYWALTDKLARNAGKLAEKRALAERVLAALDSGLARAPFLAGDAYSAADIAVFAYVHRAEDAAFALPPAVAAWVERVRATPGFVDDVVPYADDPLSAGELG